MPRLTARQMDFHSLISFGERLLVSIILKYFRYNIFSFVYNKIKQNPFKFSILLLYDHYCYCYVSAGNKPENYRDLDTAVHSNVKVIDGALVLKNVQKASEGYYLCKATNGIGRGLSAVIYISIQGIL